MESRRMTTRSSRRATTLPVSPIKQAVIANVMQASGRASSKKSTRKVLADKTNATGLTFNKSPKKATAAAAAASAASPIKAEEEVMSPFQNPPLVEQQPATPEVVRGEDLLRSLVHSNLAIIETPNGLARQSPEAETPQFGVPADHSPSLASAPEPEEAAAEVESIQPQQGQVVDAEPQVGASLESKVISMSERLSSAWLGRDVDEVTEVGEDDDSDCSVLVNVSSPGMSNIHLVASPAPVTSSHPTTPQTAGYKWQRRDHVTPQLKELESGSFRYYGGDDEYEGCDEYEAEEFDGEVIDCEEICHGISRMGMEESTSGLPEYKGRHIRFNYNSDDEIDVEEVEVMRLRGLPTPSGKHLRFPEDTEASSP